MIKTILQIVIAFLMSFGMMFFFGMIHHPQNFYICWLVSTWVVMLISNKMDD